MAVLSIDGSARYLYLALFSKNGTKSLSMDAGNTLCEILMTKIDSLLSQIKEPLEEIIVCKGPGSFTGLRIVISAAKGMSSALGIPIKCMSTLETYSLCRKNAPDELVVSAVDARRNRYYAAFFKGGKRLTEDMDISAADIAEKIRTFKPAKSVLILSEDTEIETTAFEGCNVEIVKLGSLTSPALTLLENESSCRILGKTEGPEYVRLSDAEENLNGKSL